MPSLQLALTLLSWVETAKEVIRPSTKLIIDGIVLFLSALSELEDQQIAPPT